VLHRIDVGVSFAGVQVNVREDPGVRNVGHVAPEAVEGVVPEAAGVDPGGDAGAGRHAVGLDAEFRAAPVAVGMQVDQARRDVEAAGVDDVAGALGGNVGFDSRDLEVEDGEVGPSAEPAAGVAQLPVLDEDVVADLGAQGAGCGDPQEPPSVKRP